MNKWNAVIIGVVALIVVIVVLQNTQSVETKLPFVTMTLPNAALLFGTLIIGFAIGVLTAGRIVSNAKRPLPYQLPSEELEEARRGSHGTNR